MPAPTHYWFLRFVTGVALLCACGAGLPAELLRSAVGGGRFWPLDVGLGLWAFWRALSAAGPLAQSLAVERKLKVHLGESAFAAFSRASMEQQIFLLLLGVAEADGKAGPREQELVRTFLLRRFPSARVAAELQRWSATARPPKDLHLLARHIGVQLEPGERATLYSWCCLIAFADGRLHQDEFRALGAIARGLDLESRYAQFLFEFAQQAAARNRREAHDGQRRGRARAEPAQSPASARDQALVTLGLPPNADREQIRLRHRELVRQFHPDAQRKLGPMAQQEATERFKAIQRAYEELTR